VIGKQGRVFILSTYKMNYQRKEVGHRNKRISICI
jgi:hypothetical protein